MYDLMDYRFLILREERVIMRKFLLNTMALLVVSTIAATTVSAQSLVHTDSNALVNIARDLGVQNENGYDITSFTSTSTEKNLFIAFYGTKKSYVFPVKKGPNTLPFELQNIKNYGIYSGTDKFDGQTLRELASTINIYGVTAKNYGEYYSEWKYIGADEMDRTTDNVNNLMTDLISNKKSVLDQVSFTMDGSQFVQNTSGMPFTNHVTDYDYVAIKTDNGDKLNYVFAEEVNIQELIHSGSKYLDYTFFNAQGAQVGKVNPKEILTPVDVKSVKKVVVTVQPVATIGAEKFYGNHIIHQTEFNGTKKDGSPLFVDTQLIQNVSGLYDEIGSTTKIGEVAPSTVIVEERGANGWLLIATENGNKWMKDGYNLDQIAFAGQAGLYDSPNSTIRIAHINPQRVNIIERGEDGWYKIKTWLGDKWVKDGYMLNKHTILKSSGLYNAPNTTARLAIVSPQTVNVVQRSSNGWMKINTWLGEKWMKDGYTEAVEYVYLTKTFGMYKQAGGIGYVASANPARLKVLDKAANGWYLVPTWKGNLWVKNGYNQKSPAATGKTYKVVRGDTLYGVSRKTGLSVTRIKQLNNLKTNSLYIGQVLKLN